MSGPTLAQAHDVALLDLDGVVYAGPAAVPHAVAALTAASQAGMRLAYVTNNASRVPSAVAEHLRQLGLPAEAADVVTSAQAGAGVVAALVPPGALVLTVGGQGLAAALAERGLAATTSAADDPAAVLQGYDPELAWPLLAEGAYALARGIPWVATNTDLTIPTARGIAPGNGTFVAMLATTTGRVPVVAGKPEPPLMQESLERTGARRALVVGDRLDTDIAGGDRCGLTTLLVLTGVTDLEALLHAPVGQRPSHVGLDLRALHEPGTVAHRTDGGCTAGGWAWRVVPSGHGGPGLVEQLAAGLRPADAVHSLALTCWQAADDGEELEMSAAAAVVADAVEAGRAEGQENSAL